MPKNLFEGFSKTQELRLLDMIDKLGYSMEAK